MLADARCQPGDLGLAMVGRLDRDMVEAIGKRDEIALGIDHHLLDDAGRSFEQPAQQMRLSRTRIALDEQTGGEQLLDVEKDGLARAAGADVDSCGHAGSLAERR